MDSSVLADFADGLFVFVLIYLFFSVVGLFRFSGTEIRGVFRGFSMGLVLNCGLNNPIKLTELRPEKCKHF